MCEIFPKARVWGVDQEVVRNLRVELFSFIFRENEVGLFNPHRSRVGPILGKGVS